jgi:hypothetical protein
MQTHSCCHKTQINPEKSRQESVVVIVRLPLQQGVLNNSVGKIYNKSREKIKNGVISGRYFSVGK